MDLLFAATLFGFLLGIMLTVVIIETSKHYKTKKIRMKKPFKLYRMGAGGFYFEFFARNGRLLTSSEIYTRKANAINGVVSFIKEAAEAGGVGEYISLNATAAKQLLIEDLTGTK